MTSAECCYPVPLDERAHQVLELINGQSLSTLVVKRWEAAEEERQAAALVVSAVKAACVWTFTPGTRWLAVEWLADVPDRLVESALELHREAQAIGSGEPAAEGKEGQQQQQQQRRQQLEQQRGQVLRMVSLCLARWLPCFPIVWSRAEGEAARLEAGTREGAEMRLLLLLRTACRMVRLARLAQAAAEGRGDARGAASWGRLLAVSAHTPAGDGGQEEEEDESWNEGLGGLAPLVPPPCDMERTVLLSCSNPFCINLDGDSEAGLQLVACGGRCGGMGCGGEGPCCCRECSARGDWEAVMHSFARVVRHS